MTGQQRESADRVIDLAPPGVGFQSGVYVVGLPDTAVNLRGSVELEVVLALLIEVEAIPVGGPVLGATFGVIFDIDSATGWDLDGSIEIGASGPLPDGVASTRWSRVFDIASDDGAAAALPTGDGLIVVEEGQNPWLAEFDGLGVPRSLGPITDPGSD